MFPVKKPSHSWNPAHQVTYNRAPADEVALSLVPHLQGSGLAGCFENRGLLRKGHQPWPASTALLEEAVLRSMVVLFATELLLAISITASEAKSGTGRGVQGSQGAWQQAEGMVIKMTPPFPSSKLPSVNLPLPPQRMLRQAERGECQRHLARHCLGCLWPDRRVLVPSSQGINSPVGILGPQGTCRLPIRLPVEGTY